MRHISLYGLSLPADWLQRAQQALSEIHDLPVEERKQGIKDRSSIWAELKDALSELSHGKCWYCETRQERSGNAVDHFRPKNSVAECNNHEGYWWLVFDWRNYRFSCTYCNSRRVDQVTGARGGKHDHFPLLDEDQRAYCPTDSTDVELPCLLDPTRVADPGLLWFQQDGEAVPRYASDSHRVLLQRAETSIHLYHLNLASTAERRRHLYNRVRDVVERGDRCFSRAANYSEGNHLLYDDLEAVMRDLRGMLNEREEFSAAARDFLSGFKDRGWVQAALARL